MRVRKGLLQVKNAPFYLEDQKSLKARIKGLRFLSCGGCGLHMKCCFSWESSKVIVSAADLFLPPRLLNVTVIFDSVIFVSGIKFCGEYRGMVKFVIVSEIDQDQPRIPGGKYSGIRRSVVSLRLPEL